MEFSKSSLWLTGARNDQEFRLISAPLCAPPPSSPRFSLSLAIRAQTDAQFSARTTAHTSTRTHGLGRTCWLRTVCLLVAAEARSASGAQAAVRRLHRITESNGHRSRPRPSRFPPPPRCAGHATFNPKPKPLRRTAKSPLPNRTLRMRLGLVICLICPIKWNCSPSRLRAPAATDQREGGR